MIYKFKQLDTSILKKQKKTKNSKKKGRATITISSGRAKPLIKSCYRTGFCDIDAYATHTQVTTKYSYHWSSNEYVDIVQD